LVRGPSIRNENIYKIYAESFKDQQHLDAIVSEAQEIVNDALKVL
jgi:phosphoglucomutase